jgi:hypothetical protein
MMNSAKSNSDGQFACQADLGNGCQLDVEYSAGHSLWLASGSGIKIVDLWLKSVVGSIDLRIRIQRAGTGVKISVDRGEHDVPWWSPEDVPRLSVSIEGEEAVALAEANHGPELRRSILGRVSLVRY